MFLKKHSQPEWTPAYRQRERLLLDYFAAETNLEEKAKAAIVRKGVIDLYPDGPDKDRAIKDFEAAQHSLLCAIGTVDGLRNDMRSAVQLKEIAAKFQLSKIYLPPVGCGLGKLDYEKQVRLVLNQVLDDDRFVVVLGYKGL